MIFAGCPWHMDWPATQTLSVSINAVLKASGQEVEIVGLSQGMIVRKRRRTWKQYHRTPVTGEYVCGWERKEFIRQTSDDPMALMQAGRQTRTHVLRSLEYCQIAHPKLRDAKVTAAYDGLATRLSASAHE